MSWSTADLCDEHIKDLRIATPIGLKNWGGKKSFYGKIVTIKALENNPLVRETLSENGEGKVLVVDGGGSLRCAMMGDNLAQLAIENGWNGVIIFGAIRDSRVISTLDLGVKALDTIPLKSGKNQIGDRDIPVSFADITFVPGEFVYADEDGIVVSKYQYF